MDVRSSIPIVLLMVFVVLSFLLLKPLWVALFLGAVLAFLTTPLYRFFLRKLKNKTLCALLICLIVIIIITVPSIFMVRSLVHESYVLFISVKQHLAAGLFRQCQNSFCQTIAEFGKMDFINSQVQQITRYVTNWVIQQGSDFLIHLPRIVLTLFLIFFTLFYFLRDGEKLLSWLQRISGMSVSQFRGLIARMKQMVSGIMYGHFLIALMQGALGALGFFLFGVSSPLFWGVVMAFLALIPYLGTGIIWVPAALFMFLQGVFNDVQVEILKGIGLFIYGIIFIGSSDNLLRPKLMGKKADIHPAVVLLGIMGGVFVFGVLGILVGPIILAVAALLIENYVRR